MARLLKMPEVCERLDIDIATARAWRRRNYGPPNFLVGGSVRYDEAEFDAWIESQRAGTLSGKVAAQ